MTNKKLRTGMCKLTLTYGKFVKSHIIPEALTETSWGGSPLTQPGPNGRRIRRCTSWYDPQLVTTEGEAILAHTMTGRLNFSVAKS